MVRGERRKGEKMQGTGNEMGTGTLWQRWDVRWAAGLSSSEGIRTWRHSGSLGSLVAELMANMGTAAAAAKNACDSGCQVGSRLSSDVMMSRGGGRIGTR